METEKVTIVIPIYNVEPYLRRCLDSVVAQTYKNLEVIIVDDSSTDGGAAIAKEYAASDSERFRFIQRNGASCLSAARNVAMNVATGEWVTFVDGDDWVEPDYVFSLYETAKHDNADIVMGGRYYYYPSSGKTKIMSPFSDLTTQSSQREKVAVCDPCAASRLFRRSLFVESGLIFPENVQRAAEQGIIIPLLTRTERISIYSRPLYYYYQRRGSNSMQFHKGLDVSFFPITVENVERNSLPGFEKELEYRAISDIMYGMIMNMVRSGHTKDEVVERVQWFNDKYPHWKENPYLSKMDLAKRIFTLCADRKLYLGLKCLIWAWDSVH